MKLQKIMLDGGFTCPNRDGRVGRGGCTFCLCESFNPDYCRKHSTISAQLQAGKEFFQGKYAEMQYLAYFQAYSSTYASVEVLRERYEEALSVEDVVGIVVATRPDCITDEILCLFDEIRDRGFSVALELGCESLYNRTLKRINRGHTVEQTYDAINLCHKHDIPLTVHLMFGLPGESEADILAEADMLNALPVTKVKIHQLQILRGTRISLEWEREPSAFIHFTLESYAQLVANFVGRLRTDIHIERYASSAPSDMLIAPRFGVKPSVVEARIKNLMARK